MSYPNKWVLIAGGPQSGKTTLVKHLAELGYKTKEEQARSVLDRYINEGIDVDDIRNDLQIGSQFQEEIALKEIDAESKIPPGQLTFFDRSCIEYLAFVAHRQLRPNNTIVELLSKRRYALAIILESVPNQSFDNRVERGMISPLAESNRQKDAIKRVIKSTGTPIEYLPIELVHDRCSHTIDICNRYGLIAAKN